MALLAGLAVSPAAPARADDAPPVPQSPVTAPVAQPDTPPVPAEPVLQILRYGNGGRLFDRLIADLVAAAGTGVRPEYSETNSLAAFHAFCQDRSGTSPNILVTAQRRISSTTANGCASGDALPVTEVELGRGALVMAVRKGTALKGLTSHQVYLALARDVPYRDEFRRNTSIRWSDIDRSLPSQDIRFQLPPRDVGGRALFDSVVLQGGCRQDKLVKVIFSAQHRTARCVTTRIDRVREIRRDQAVRELMEAPEGTVGVMPYSDFSLAGGDLVALALDGVAPNAETILNDDYDLSGSFWLYARRAQPGSNPAVDAAVSRVIAWASSEAAIGPDGDLAALGMVPLSLEQREVQRDALSGEGGSWGIAAMLSWASYTASSAWSLAGIEVGDLNPPDTADSIDLTKLMDIAGYKIKQIETTFGLIPGADMTFGIAREMSQSDQEYLERTLYRDLRRRPSLLSAIQRRIVRTIIDVSSTEGYEVSKVDISLFPLPSVKLVVTPSAPVIGPETTLLMQAIERVQDRISESSR